MRLVKRSVNQDDVSAYHLFYADARGHARAPTSPSSTGPCPRERRGTRSIVRTRLRVTGGETLAVVARAPARARRAAGARSSSATAALTLDFEDPEGQRLALVDDGGAGDAPHPWERSPVPAEHQIRGLGPIVHERPDARAHRRACSRGWSACARCASTRTRTNPAHTRARVRDGARAGRTPSCTWRCSRTCRVARPGAGGVHHVAFRTPDADYDAWAERLNALGHAQQRRDGPLLVPQPVLPRAQRRSCSRSPPTAPASRWTRIPRRWASRSCCRRSWSRAARAIVAGLKPID